MDVVTVDKSDEITHCCECQNKDIKNLIYLESCGCCISYYCQSCLEKALELIKQEK